MPHTIRSAGPEPVLQPPDGTQGERPSRRAEHRVERPHCREAEASLTGKASTGAYRTAIDRNLPHGFTVSRADLATAMLASLSDPATVHRHVAIAS